MKKLLSLSAGVLLAAVTLAQDTIPSPNTTTPNMPGTTMDTLPISKNATQDTAMNRPNQWQDSMVNRSSQDTAMSNAKWPDSSAGHMDQIDTSMHSSSKMPETSPSAKSNWPDTSMTGSTQKTTEASAMSTEKSTGSTLDGESTKVVKDRVMMKDGLIMVIRNGESTPLEDKITLASGAVVMKDGSVTYSNGKTATLKDGQYINLIADEKEKSRKKGAKIRKSKS